MIKKNAFTLIELLAIIVILAIIAVITIPIILNVVENAKEGAAIDSAYGFQDAVQKYFLTESVKDFEQELPNGYKYVFDLPNKFTVNGDVPTQDSCIELSKGIVKSFSLKFGDYVVTKDANGEISVEKGANVSQIGCVDSFSKEYLYGYTNEEKELIVEKTGYYKLEVWGAQGGSYNETDHGGYGGYASGFINLNQGDKLYINVGGQGVHVGGSNQGSGGYNGGGAVDFTWSDYNERRSTGGGATHIALRSGLLSTLENYKNDILIVAGGGGGVGINHELYPKNSDGIGGNGGGFEGTAGTSEDGYYGLGGTQLAGGQGDTYGAAGLFGRSANSSESLIYPGLLSGAGGGYYGGGSSFRGCGGGSGYIGNSLLVNKEMYCYNCTESNDTATKTISTTNVSDTPISQYAKKEDGYAKITYVGMVNP